MIRIIVFDGIILPDREGPVILEPRPSLFAPLLSDPD